jgi:hypothetical protein
VRTAGSSRWVEIRQLSNCIKIIELRGVDKLLHKVICTWKNHTKTSTEGWGKERRAVVKGTDVDCTGYRSYCLLVCLCPVENMALVVAGLSIST